MMNNDKQVILDYFKKALDVFDTNEKPDRLAVYQETVQILKLYLEKMDVITSCKCITAKEDQFVSDIHNNYEKRILLSQTGIRYSQAKSLAESIENYYKFETKPKKYKEIIIDEILNCVKGGLLEDLITVNCLRIFPERFEVFKVMFDPIYGVVDRAGEFDMVVYDKENRVCELYEIKHDSLKQSYQTSHLTDAKKIDWILSHYGPISKKAVLYLGESQEKNADGIEYINANDFLDDLKKYDPNYNKNNYDCIDNLSKRNNKSFEKEK